MKEYIYSKQATLFGHKDVIGFGDDSFYVKEIDRVKANDTIKKNHYSGKIYNGTYIHLGIFINDDLLGVLQYGYAMNPASAGSVVTGTAINEYLELNRMWLDDKAGKNSESKAIAYSIRYIKNKYPKIKWIQSFADERCGCFGIVYQACSFSYYGEHDSIFWELDGVVYHNSIMTRKDVKGYKILTAKENKKRVMKHKLRQFRYIKFIDKREKKKCTLIEKPYPKYYNENA